MKWSQKKANRLIQNNSRRLTLFAQREDGAISIFALYLVFMMVLLTGIAADLMRHEMERTRLQAVADRAVLAAANLSQTQDPEFVVRDYFTKAGLQDFVSDVIVDEGLNYRTVTVDANQTINTQFMDFLGRETLNVRGLSAADERVNKVEISMVLDISGSMRRNNKMARLRDAATEFVDTVLTPDVSNQVSISLVPYTAQVNAGSDIFNELNITPLHNYTYCVDFEEADFRATALDQTQPYQHMQHFDAGYSWSGSTRENSISNPGCPKRPYEEIIAFEDDQEVLTNAIEQFQPRANTAIHIGMKWGVAMLDPAFNAITRRIPGVSSFFQNRPAAYSDQDTLKTIILMTDGENVTTYRINPALYANQNQRRHWSIYPVNWYLRNHVRYSQHSAWLQTRYTPGQADMMLQNICDAAKARNILIWTIGFEVGDHGADVMRNCASSPSHFFRVEGVEISDAFSAIARQISQLRLTL